MSVIGATPCTKLVFLLWKGRGTTSFHNSIFKCHQKRSSIRALNLSICMLVTIPLSGTAVSKLIPRVLISLQVSLLASVKDLSPNSIIYIPCPLIFLGSDFNHFHTCSSSVLKFSHMRELDFTQTLGCHSLSRFEMFWSDVGSRRFCIYFICVRKIEWDMASLLYVVTC